MPEHILCAIKKEARFLYIGAVAFFIFFVVAWSVAGFFFD